MAKKKKKELSVDADKDLIGSILKEFGGDDGAQLLRSNSFSIKINGVVSTRIPVLDYIMGRGGFPNGRMIVFVGKEASGKSTAALSTAAEFQAEGGLVVYFDLEHKLDPDYAKKLGVDLEKIVIIQPPYIEKVLTKTEKIIDIVEVKRKQTGKKVPALVVIDSVDASISKAEFEGEIGDHHIAASARAYAQYLPRLLPKMSKQGVTLLCINQPSVKIGAVFGNKTTMKGGKALRHYASVVVEFIGFRPKDGKQKVLVKCIKNQVAPPFKEGVFNLILGKGIDIKSSWVDVATELGMFTKKGAKYFPSEDGEEFGGKKKTAKLIDNKMIKKIRKLAGW